MIPCELSMIAPLFAGVHYSIVAAYTNVQ